MLDSYDEFNLFRQEYKPRGVEKGTEVHFFNPADKFNKRYPVARDFNGEYPIKDFQKYFSEEAFLISPENLQTWFQEQNKEVELRDLIVLKLRPEQKGVTVVTNEGEAFFDEVYVATSYISKTLLKGFNSEFDTYLSYTKEVAGTYLEIDMWKEHPTCSYDLEGHHLIFRSEQKKVLIGSTSDQGPVEHSNQEIKSIYEKINSHYQGELPDFDQWTIKTGIRHKGRKRTPYWGEIAPGLFTVCGLYKNGYTFAFKAAKDLIISQRTPF